MAGRHPTDRWSKEEFLDRIVNPLRQGRTVVQVSKDVGVARCRIYALLRQFGFKNKDEVLSDTEWGQPKQRIDA